MLRFLLHYLKWEHNHSPSSQTAPKLFWEVPFWENSSVQLCFYMRCPLSSIICSLWKVGLSRQSERFCNILFLLSQLMLETTYRPDSAHLFSSSWGTFRLLWSLRNTQTYTGDFEYRWKQPQPAAVRKMWIQGMNFVPLLEFICNRFSSSDPLHCCLVQICLLTLSQSFLYNTVEDHIKLLGNSSVYCLTW